MFDFSAVAFVVVVAYNLVSILLYMTVLLLSIKDKNNQPFIQKKGMWPQMF